MSNENFFANNEKNTCNAIGAYDILSRSPTRYTVDKREKIAL